MRISRVAAAARWGWNTGTEMARTFKRKRSSSRSTSHISRTSSRSAPSTGRRVRLKFQRGKTSTKRGRSRQRNKASNDQITGGRDVTGFTYNIKGVVTRKKLSFVSAKHVYRIAYSNRLVCQSGVQNVDLLGYNGVTGNIAGAGIYSMLDVSNIKNAISTIGSGVLGANNATQFAIPVCKCEYMLTNSTNANVIIWLYDIIPRKNVYNTDTAWQVPQNAWQNGIRQQAGTGGSVGTQFNIGSKPFESKLFCETYKVRKVTKIIMAPGALHRHIVRSTQRRWFTDAQYNNLFNGTTVVPSSTNYWIGGRTVLTMMVMMGAPAHSFASADAQHVSSGLGAIDMITTKTYEYMYSATAAKTVYWSDQVPVVGDLEVVPEAGDHFVAEDIN